MKRKSSKANPYDHIRSLACLPVTIARKILKQIAEAALENTHSSRTELHGDYHAVFDSIACVDEFAYKEQENKSWSLEYLEPALLVQTILSQRSSAAEYFVLALARHEGTYANPWKCIVAFDECQFGSLNKLDSTKKYMCMYFTFSELSLPSTDLLWFCPVVARSTELHKIVGGWSHVLARVLKRMFVGACGMSTVGVTFSYKNRDYIFFATLSVLLSDGDGLKQAIGWRGAGSIRPSIIHDNILMKGSDLVSRANGYVEISCVSASLLHKTTTAEFEDRCDLVEAAYKRLHVDKTISKSLYDNIIKTESMNFVPYGLAFDRSLRGRVDFFKALTVDWMHTWLQDGVFSKEAALLIQAAKGSVQVKGLVSFLRKPWQFPHGMRYKGTQLWKIFDERRLDSKGEVDKIRASASELLGLLALLRHYAAVKISHTAALAPHWKSFQACCKVVDLILAAKRRTVSPRDNATKLQKLLEEYMRAHLSCYGDSHLIPKHSWQWALIWQWLRDNKVWDCFVVEREHLQVKSIAERIDNTTRGERAVLAGVIREQMSDLTMMHSPCCLRGHTFQCDDFPHAMFANRMTVWGTTYEVGAVVIHERTAGIILSCALENGELCAVVEKFDFVAQVSPSGTRWVRTDNIEFARAAELNMAYLGRSRIFWKLGWINYFSWMGLLFECVSIHNQSFLERCDRQPLGFLLPTMAWKKTVLSTC